MSNKALYWARVEVRGLNPSAKLVLMMLADHKNETTGECFPSIPTLAAETGLSESGVKLAIKELEAAKLLTRNYRPEISRTDYALHTGGSVSDPQGGQSVTPGGSVSDPKTERKQKSKQKPLVRSSDRTEPDEIEQEFLMLWDFFPKNPNSSKKKAQAAFRRLSAAKRSRVIDGALKYCDFLREQNAKRKPGDPHPVMHLTTFIHEERYETFLETTEEAA